MEGKTHDTPCINQQFAFASLSHTCLKLKATSLSRDHALFTHCVHGIYYQGSNESPFFFLAYEIAESHQAPLLGQSTFGMRSTVVCRCALNEQTSGAYPRLFPCKHSVSPGEQRMEATGRKRTVAAFHMPWCACSQAEPGAPCSKEANGRRGRGRGEPAGTGI
jgi:hypothetical protein